MEMYKKYKPSKEYLAYLDSLPKSFFVTVLENSYNEHIVYDADGKILYVNPACIRHYGLKPEEMINRNNADVYQGYWTPPGLDVFHSKKILRSCGNILSLQILFFIQLAFLSSMKPIVLR